MCPSALEVLASIVPPSLSQVAASAMGHPDPVGSSIRVALAAKQTGSRTNIERRREPRYPYPYPIYITPVDRDLVPLANETVSVLGKHLSEHGLDFYHREPIAHRRVIASLALCEGDWLGLLMDLTWCRFKGQGLYDNGGRFISVTRSPMLSVHEGLKTIRAESGT
ncbi:hypothetical protein Psta_2403 [Pirellula staleyi DSM 6068]|uniref:Uncharacterized protein n=1 Tax=Pirellula staleyi (strain ATCC 27377 / DSM 6068 / ICPB 4128) TaxID=530564 RepID=D2R4K7_PIRSD|nr:hypothetical protein Psta_2403 [Pirellula staleyi DSM 6068]